MLQLYKADERGKSDLGWLNSRHTFSFGDFYDPRKMGFAYLRVFNEDRVAGGAGFPTHPHRDMEIISYVLEGGLEHKDSMGTGSIIRAGDLQKMSAGSGVTHSEFNASTSEKVHFYQIWILPSTKSITPDYGQLDTTDIPTHDQWGLVASGYGESGVLRIHQKVRIYLANLAAGGQLDFAPADGNMNWLQVVRGSVVVNGAQLSESDGAALTETEIIQVSASSDARLLVFDMAPS